MKSFGQALKNIGSTLSAAKKANNQIINQAKQICFQNCLDWMVDMLAHPCKHTKAAIIIAPEGVASAGQFFANVTKLAGHVTYACGRAACTSFQASCGDLEAIKKIAENSLKACNFLEKKVPQVTARLEKLTLDYIDFCKLSIENPDEACKIIHQQQANAHVLLDSVSDMLEKTDKVKFTETATKFGVECGTFHFGFKAIGHMGAWTWRGLSNRTNRLIKTFEKTKMPKQVATTPEGLTIAMNEAQEALKGAQKARQITLSPEILEKAAKETVKNGFQLVGKGSTLRELKYAKALKHAYNRHFFYKTQRLKDCEYALKNLDPFGNPDKWTQCLIRIAQTARDGEIMPIMSKGGEVIGEQMDVWGKMIKTAGEFPKLTGNIGTVNSLQGILTKKELERATRIILKFNKDYVKLGVRLFRFSEMDPWVIATILT